MTAWRETPRLAGQHVVLRPLECADAPALAAAASLPDDMLGPFLLVARAARDGMPCPSDEAIAASYGTASLGRARRLLQYIESRDLIVSRTDLSGKRSIAIPTLGWATAAD